MINMKKHCIFVMIAGLLAVMFQTVPILNSGWEEVTDVLFIICFLSILVVFCIICNDMEKTEGLDPTRIDKRAELVEVIGIYFLIYIALSIFTVFINLVIVSFIALNPNEENILFIAYYEFIMSHGIDVYKEAVESFFITVISVTFLLTLTLGVYKDLDDKNDKQLEFDFK